MRKIPCARCSRPIAHNRGTSLPPGQATCQPCRRAIREEQKVARTEALAERRAAAARRRTTPKPVTILAPKVCRRCSTRFVPSRKTQTYCTPECRDQRARSGNKASAAQRGYGQAHRLARAKWKPQVDAGLATCCLCHQPIKPGTKWHLDHTPDRAGYRGVAHEKCNTSDGATRGNRQRGRRAPRNWSL